MAYNELDTETATEILITFLGALFKASGHTYLAENGLELPFVAELHSGIEKRSVVDRVELCYAASHEYMMALDVDASKSQDKVYFDALVTALKKSLGDGIIVTVRFDTVEDKKRYFVRVSISGTMLYLAMDVIRRQ